MLKRAICIIYMLKSNIFYDHYKILGYVNIKLFTLEKKRALIIMMLFI